MHTWAFVRGGLCDACSAWSVSGERGAEPGRSSRIDPECSTRVEEPGMGAKNTTLRIWGDPLCFRLMSFTEFDFFFF